MNGFLVLLVYGNTDSHQCSFKADRLSKTQAVSHFQNHFKTFFLGHNTKGADRRRPIANSRTETQCPAQENKGLASCSVNLQARRCLQLNAKISMLTCTQSHMQTICHYWLVFFSCLGVMCVCAIVYICGFIFILSKLTKLEQKVSSIKTQAFHPDVCS